MANPICDQTAVVVGASSGMGRAIAVALAREGFHVVAAARREERLEELERQLHGAGCAIEVCVTDVTQRVAGLCDGDQSPRARLVCVEP